MFHRWFERERAFLTLHVHARPDQSHTALGTQLHVHVHVATGAIHVANTKRKLRSGQKSFFIRPISNTDRLLAETDAETKADLRRMVKSLTAREAALMKKEARLLEMKDRLLGGLTGYTRPQGIGATGYTGRWVSYLVSQLGAALLSVPLMCAHVHPHAFVSLSLSRPLNVVF